MLLQLVSYVVSIYNIVLLILPLIFLLLFFLYEHVCRPNEGFVEQLKLWGAMRCRLDLNYKPYKVYRLQMHSTTRDSTEGAQEIQWNLQNKDALRKEKFSEA